MPFLFAFLSFAAVGIVAGILIARRIDAWDAAQDAPTDPPEDRAP
jgi:hypothetical protein